MAASYRVCGLGLQFNVPVAGLERLPAHPRVDVRVTLGALPAAIEAAARNARDYYVESLLDERGEPCMSVARLQDGAYFRLAYSEGVTIVVDARGSEVWAAWKEALSIEDAVSFVTGSALGFVLRLRGITCIHGSAIRVGDSAVAVAGPSGSGKSSTAAGFARLGHAILSDDILALTEMRAGFVVEPAFPRVHLWPQSARSMFGSWDALPRIAPNWDKRHLDLEAHGFAFERAPLPLAAIYFLDERSAADGIPVIEPVSPGDALIALVCDSHATEFVEAPQRAAEFDVLARVLARVPARRVMPCADLARIPELCEAIVRDFGRITGAQAAAA